MQDNKVGANRDKGVRILSEGVHTIITTNITDSRETIDAGRRDYGFFWHDDVVLAGSCVYRGKRHFHFTMANLERSEFYFILFF